MGDSAKTSLGAHILKCGCAESQGNRPRAVKWVPCFPEPLWSGAGGGAGTRDGLLGRGELGPVLRGAAGRVLST